jgi:hypothetical protein
MRCCAVDGTKSTAFSSSCRLTFNPQPQMHRWNVCGSNDAASGRYFPYYLRNLNTGADNIGLETKTVVAEQKV